MALPHNIRSLRKRRGWSQDELADKLGYRSYTTIQKWESGVSEPPLKIVHALAELFDVDINILTNGDVNVESVKIPNHPQFLPMPKMKQWRVIGATACGEPTHQELEELVWAPDNINADLVFRCVGDSMIGAHIFDGDIAFVRFCPVEDGQIAVVRVEDEYSLKRIYRGPDYLELRSENPKHPPIIIRGEQTNAEIIGKVVYFITRPI